MLVSNALRRCLTLLMVVCYCCTTAVGAQVPHNTSELCGTNACAANGFEDFADLCNVSRVDAFSIPKKSIFDLTATLTREPLLRRRLVNASEYYVIEGVICNDQFLSYGNPVLRRIDTPVTQLNCLTRFSVNREYVRRYDIPQGIALVKRSKTLVFPALWSRVDNEAILEWVTSPQRPERDGILMITTPLGPCSVRTEYLRLPSLDYNGRAAVFYTTEADSRDCGLFRPNGHAAAAVVPVGTPGNQRRADALRILFGEDSPLRGMAENPIFVAHALQFHHVRAVIIEWDALVEPSKVKSLTSQKSQQPSAPSEMPLAYITKFLTTLFETGIITVVATFEKNTVAYSGSPHLLKIQGLEVLTAPGLPLPSPEYIALLNTIPSRYFIRTITEKEQRQWFRIASHVSEIERNYSLISAVVDGDYSTRHHQESFNFPITFLMQHWMRLTEDHPYISKPARFSTIQPQEILVFATSTRHKLRCGACIIIDASNGLEAKQLRFM